MLRTALADDRFIPVLTGNTRVPPRKAMPIPVHPRAYGEHILALVIAPSETGSSPCLRGTPERYAGQLDGVRFIPVLTGNTPSLPPFPVAMPVHPRAYGEHGNKGVMYNQVGGSSPCLRGTPGPTVATRRGHRFIPVLTGNTCYILL